tara:strand:+ start:536 stop:1372 length:837 start_codon:yes stop_codon:yes gene_type:complete
MDNFDLRKYLAENRLFNFRPKLPITDYVDIDQEELNQLYDRLKDEFEGNVGEFIEEYGQDFLSPNIEKINKYYGAKVLERDVRDDFFLADGLEFISSNERFEKWLDRNKQFYLAEGQLYESEFDPLADELAAAIEVKLDDKKDELNEVIDPISILSYVLAGNTLVNIMAKYVSKFFDKYDFGKGKEAADKIYNFTHKLEDDFKGPIKRVVGLFAKDPKVKENVTDGLFALLLLGLGAKAGTEAFNALKASNVISGGLSSLKAALKGKDIVGLIKNIAA